MKKNKLHLTFILFYLNIIIIMFLTSGCDKENEAIEENYLPSCLITSPNYADEIPQESIIKISVKAKDSIGYIKKVELYIDEIKKVTLTNGQNEYNWLWDTSDESLGNHTISAIAYDYEDGSSSSKLIVDVTSNKISDIENNIYKIVRIGSQIWMAENLRATKYNDGTPIQLVTNNNSWENLTSPAYCWYQNNINYKSTFGALYTGYTVLTEKLCPDGWHVPTYDEWITLRDYLGDSSAVQLKSKDMWEICYPYILAGTDKYGFKALPSGWRTGDGTFVTFGTEASYWSSTKEKTYTGWSTNLVCYANNLRDWDLSLVMGYSVRCVKD